MRKVILHNFSIPYARSASGFFNIDQSGIFFAEKGDFVVTRQRPPEAFLQYLETLGYDFKGLQFIWPKKSLAEDSQSIFEDTYVKTSMKSLVQNSSVPSILDSFMLTESEALWAKDIGVGYIGDPSHYHLFGNKSYFRTFMKKKGFLIPRGFSNQRGKIDGAIKSALLFLSGATEVVVKQDEGVAGLGSRKFSKQELLTYGTVSQELFPSPNELGVLPTHSDRFVVEKWYQNVVCSPSIQLYVDFSGEVSIISVHVQNFYSNNMSYAGCSSEDWLENQVAKRIREEGRSIIKELATKGFRGHCALNAIVLDNTKIMWVELNPRRVISSYPFQIIQRVCDNTVHEVSYLTVSIYKERWKGKTVAEILKELDPILYTPSAYCGVILMHYHFLESLGEITLLCVGRNREEVKHVSRGAHAM